jgi:GNAT superfamily N-acetyltransferase
MSSGVQTRPGIQEYRNGQYHISTDRSRLDVGLVHQFLTREFWDTEGVPRAVLERSIGNSLCFGVFDGEQQIGFARVITDQATFAFICDDFIVESHRGRGLGKWLMQCILGHPGLQGLRRIMLVTRDPRLYVKAGFAPLKAPEEYMEIYDPEIYRRGGAGQ